MADYYRVRGVLVPVDGVGTVDEVAERIDRALERPELGEVKDVG